MIAVLCLVLVVAVAALGGLLADANGRAARWQAHAETLEDEADDLRRRLILHLIGIDQ